jgi:hypothetical protein
VIFGENCLPEARQRPIAKAPKTLYFHAIWIGIPRQKAELAARAKNADLKLPR